MTNGNIFASTLSARNQNLRGIAKTNSEHGQGEIHKANKSNSAHGIAIDLCNEIIIDENDDELNENA